jgi:hypothetical protein
MTASVPVTAARVAAFASGTRMRGTRQLTRADGAEQRCELYDGLVDHRPDRGRVLGDARLGARTSSKSAESFS